MSKERIAAGGLPAPFAAGPACWLRALFHGNAGRTRSAASYPQATSSIHYYLGDPLEVLMLRVDGTTEHVVVGPDLRGGQFAAAP